jgi:hypothetical protein
MSFKYLEIPSVLIQDPLAGHAYVISSDELGQFALTPQNLASINDGVVTFVVPDDDFIETTPPFNASGTKTPSIIIQVLSENKSFLLSYKQLQLYRVEQPNDYGGYGISFVIPAGNEFLEDLSSVQQAMLQSGENFPHPDKNFSISVQQKFIDTLPNK